GRPPHSQGDPHMLRFTHKHRSGNRLARRPTPRPRLEPLEDRTLLTAGALDPTFGDGGLVTTDFRSITRDNPADLVVVQPDGKIVVAGSFFPNDFSATPEFALVRYNADGTLDSTFGTEGRVLTHFGLLSLVSGLAAQADGKIVVVGTSFF